MHPFVIRMLIIFLITFFLSMIRRVLVRKSIKNKVEMPNLVQQIGLSVQVGLTILLGPWSS